MISERINGWTVLLHYKKWPNINLPKIIAKLSTNFLIALNHFFHPQLAIISRKISLKIQMRIASNFVILWQLNLWSPMKELKKHWNWSILQLEGSKIDWRKYTKLLMYNKAMGNIFWCKGYWLKHNNRNNWERTSYVSIFRVR